MKNFIKKKITSLNPSATLAINEKCRELIAEGKKIYRFGFGQSPFPVPEKIVESLNLLIRITFGDEEPSYVPT